MSGKDCGEAHSSQAAQARRPVSSELNRLVHQKE